MTHSELVKKVLDELAKKYWSDTIISEGYPYYNDAHDRFTELLAEAVAKEIDAVRDS